MNDLVAVASESRRVLAPASVGEVQQLVREAASAGERLTLQHPPRGRAVGLTLERLDRILELDPADHLARVEAGVPLGALAAALRPLGLRFVPGDGPFHAGEPIGELYRRGLGHARSLKYGAAKHFLLGSRIVLPTGELLATGGRTVKNVTGYDLTRFLVSPFAAWGVTVELTLKLLPAPPARRTLCARFASAGDAAAFALDARDAVLPAFLLWADPEAQRLASAPGPHVQLVLLELDGVEEEVRDAAAAVASLAERHGGSVAEHDAGDPGPAAAFEGAGGLVVRDELAVDAAALFGFGARFAAAAQACGIRAGLFGKLAEGVLSLRLARGDPRDVAAALDVAAAAGARTTGRRAQASGRRGGALLDVERELARLLDPGGVLAW